MPERIVAKFKGKPGEYLGGVPSRDLIQADFEALTDEQKATVAASSIYELRGDAPKDAAAAEKRVERVESTPTVADVGPAPKEGK
jgi:hypothetical protein